MKKIYLKKLTAFAGILSFSLAGTAGAFECKVKQSSMAKPSGFPSRALTMIVPVSYTHLTLPTICSV